MKWQHENFIWSTNSWKIINVDSYLLTQISSLYIHDRIIYVLPTLDKNVKKKILYATYIINGDVTELVISLISSETKLPFSQTNLPLSRKNLMDRELIFKGFIFCFPSCWLFIY
jgi:hypothetical protein